MKNILKMFGASGLLCLLFVAPAKAQIVNGLDFTTAFPFWVGGVKLPAGSYSISPSEQTESILKISDASGAHSAMVQFNPTQADNAHASSDVTFHRYGKAEYLNMAWVGGQKYGMQVDPSKEEQKAAATAKAETHKVSATPK
jgi:hypothetical protein